MKYNFGTPLGWYKCIETCRSDYNIYIVKKKILCIVGWNKELRTRCMVHIKIKKSIFKLILHIRWIVTKCKDVGLLLSLFLYQCVISL